jgi:cyclophilin family peptidyl-prolyl cis-trans isomerase
MKSRILEVFVVCFALAWKANAQMPVILSEPLSATNNIASAADFTVVATNAATYQWYFQGTNNLPGATNATLGLDDLSTNQAGSYTVVVTSSNNVSVTSAPPAVLTIVSGTVLQWTISTYPDGSSSNFVVQLFDHDKPATVENFIHYITAGAYSNVIFDRDATNFVLQGGDYVTTDRTTNGLHLNALMPGTNFPSQVDNEFDVGPLIHNEFGTLAMAKISGEPDSARSAFFFNLADNSANLDNQNSGFTVFGRILYGTNSGSNVLQYFSTLSAPSNGIIDYSSSNLSIGTLPVNYDGTNEPTDANLFYCDFAFLTPPPVDTTPPTVSITSPSNNMLFTNAGALTVQGTAQDNVGLAEVFCVLTLPTGAIQTNAAVGTTNWSVNLGYLQSGTYQLTAYAQDGAGNLSAPATESFSATLPSGTIVQITFSGFPDGSSSNVLVQLFDQEKPATVANFLHYITPALLFDYYPTVAVSNMFWDRCIPGFVLQGGDYDAPDRTLGNPLQDAESINSDFTESQYYSPPFAGQVDNEYNVGPVISNTFGTLAMAKKAGAPNSAANAFFFNLADNSTNLDNQDGGYTVFGRVISGSNVLQYFNTLSKPNQGIFDSTTVSTDQSLSDLPVNYHGLAAPANSNLFFADFTLLSNFKADTNPPTVVVDSPTNGQTMTKADVVFEGTASDNVAVANVACLCHGSNYQNSLYANGTTNWTVDLGNLPPGTYTNFVFSQDGAGNQSTQASNVIVVPRFPFVAYVIGNGTLSTNLNPTNSIVGGNYAITAKPGKGAEFVNWSSGTNAVLSPTLPFILDNGLQITANFISNNVGGGITITSPGAYSAMTNTTFSIQGKLAAGFSPTQLTCQVFSAFNFDSVTTNMVIPVAAKWSTPMLTLGPGLYIMQAVAQAANGRGALLFQEFTILAPLTVIVYGQSRPFITNGTYLRVGTQYTEGVNPGRNETFVSWNEGGGAFASPTFPFVMSSGLTLTLTLASNTSPGQFTITSPKANSQVTNPTVTLEGKINSSLVATQILCQLFENNAPLTSFMPASFHGTNWTLLMSNLTMGVYNAVAIATDTSGNTAAAEEQFTINFFPNIAGSYKGLFFDPSSVSETNAGSISFRLTSAMPTETQEYGLVSGNLTFPQHSYPFATGLTNTGSATVQPVGFDGYLTMSFDLTNFSGLMTGFVTKGGEASPLTAYRPLTKLSTNTAPSPGHYVLSLEPETPTNGTLNGPPGASFAAVTVSANGNLAVAGTMADNSSFSQSSGVFTNGVWPLYAGFYNGHGILIGWETNLPSGQCSGTIFWVKSPGNGSYYTNGVDEQLDSVGTNYTRPAPGAQYQIVFGGGTLASFVTNVFSFNATGSFVPGAGTTNQLKGSLVLSTGVLKGSIENPFNKNTLDFSGVWLSPSARGSGFTLDADRQTGYFNITPVPP